MALTLVSQPEYKIDTPGFDQLVFTAGSPEYLALPSAVHFAAERNSVLQSAREAVAFRMAAQGADGANLYQTTRTSALYFKDGDKCYVAFDDDPAENILLAKAQEGYNAHNSAGKWLVKKSDPLINGAFQRAAKADRIRPVPLENTVGFSTAARNGTSEYASSKLVRATIGDMAKRYAAFLQQNRYGHGYECFLTATNLEQIGVDKNTVEVRRVGVGGYVGNVNLLGANFRCDGSGRARGVREHSTGNSG